MKFIEAEHLPEEGLHSIYIHQGYLTLEYRWGKKGASVIAEGKHFRVVESEYNADLCAFQDTGWGFGIRVPPAELPKYIESLMPVGVLPA